MIGYQNVLSKIIQDINKIVIKSNQYRNITVEVKYFICEITKPILVYYRPSEQAIFCLNCNIALEEFSLK